MSNGLGAGFFALTVLAVLGGLALLDVLATAVSWVFYRRTGHVPAPLRYLLVAVGCCVLGATGFSVLLLYDEAPAAAGLFAAIVLVPLLVANVYLGRATDLDRFDVVVTAVMAWGLPFLLGVVVVFGTMNGISSALDLAPAESRRLGIGWVASATGGLVVVGGMLPIGTRLGRLLRSATGSRESG